MQLKHCGLWLGLLGCAAVAQAETPAPTKAVAGQAELLPWTLDAGHSHVGFSVKHLLISKVRGHFDDIKGVLMLDAENIENSKVSVVIATLSVDTSDDKRDDHLRSADFLGSQRFPEMRFESTKVRTVGDHQLAVDGKLTIRGVTKPITLDVTYSDRITDPWGKQRMGISATGSIDRHDFGVSWNANRVAAGAEVRLDINAEFVHEAKQLPAVSD